MNSNGRAMIRIFKGKDPWRVLLHFSFIATVVAMELFSSEKGRQLPVLMLYAIVNSKRLSEGKKHGKEVNCTSQSGHSEE